MTTANPFHLFDIRGEYPSEVNERLAFLIGKALLSLYKPKRVLVACDTRDSSPKLRDYLLDGLGTGSAQLIDLGEVPMPQFSYSCITGKYDLGIMVTASHSASSENGFKFYGKGGLPLDQKDLYDLKKTVDAVTGDPVVFPRPEVVRGMTTESYLSDLQNKLPVKKFTSRVVIDTTRSSVTTAVHVLFNRLKIKYLIVKSDHDGNPLLPENRRPIEKMVLRNKAHLGLMWDSDGDRFVCVDASGKLIPMGFVLGMLAADTIRRHGGGKAAVDCRAGLVVKELVEEAGGELLVFPSWVQFLKFAMRDDPKIVFGGEMSGHYIFRDFYSIDDGIYASLRFLALSEAPDFRENLQRLSRKYFELPETNFPCPNKAAPAILQRTADYYRTNDDNQVHLIDGVTVYGKTFKLNLRQSLTEPQMRLNLETYSEAEAKKRIGEIEKLIGKIR